MPTKHLYKSKTGSERLDSAIALRRAIEDSLKAGCRTVPMTVDVFCTMTQHEDLANTRTLEERLLAFASSCGLRFRLENHALYVRFYV
jgi:hypothetical protein